MNQKLIVLAITSAIAVTGCSQQATQTGAEFDNDAVSDAAADENRLQKYDRRETVKVKREVTGVKEQATDNNAPRDRAVLGQLAEESISVESKVLKQDVVAASVSTHVNQQSYVNPSLPMQVAVEPTDRENYLQIAESEVKLAHADPLSTFSVDVDTAAYSNIRRMLLREGRLPPRDAVRIEELVNYFDYDYPKADSLDAPFSVFTEVAPAPWNPGKHLLHIGLEGYQPEETRPDANLVFLVDVSGSMRDANKLTLVKRSLKLLVSKMEENDRIALVVYAGAAGVVLDSTSGDQKHTINQAIDNLNAGGSTNGGAGIKLAYDIASRHFIQDGINRVIIASDGDMNVGTVSLTALKDLVKQKRESGVSLTTLGFGSGNYNSALMEQLADVGNGNAAYIDGIREAQKVLVDEMQSTLLTIAKDVKIQIEFNPAVVEEYRLIGYQNRILNKEDFRNDKVDAGEIGAGHTVTALYEVVLSGSNQGLVPKLRYGQEQSVGTLERKQKTELAYVRLRYKEPNGSVSREIAQPVFRQSVKSDIADASQNLRFSAAVAGFGQLLRGGKFTRDWGLDEAIALAKSARGEDPHGYRSEFVSMAKLAKGYAPEFYKNKG